MVHLELLYKPAGASRSVSDGRLVVVSNRVAAPSASGASGAAGSGAGGLAVALQAALKARGGIWFGWSGKVSQDSNAPVQERTHGSVTYALSDLSRRDLDEYYHGFANRALWPICHYRLDLAKPSAPDSAGYFRVNEFFARRLARMIRPNDVIWVHDYHFIPMAAFLRQLGCANRIGFFLHIPWPSPDVARALPAYDRILRAMSAYDVVGFQTEGDAENFRNCLVQAKAGRAGGDVWREAYGRRFQVDAFPISIDAEAFAEEARVAEKNVLVKRMRASLEGRPLIIGVDRLDYSKGIRQRIEAFASFLEQSPLAAKSRVTMLQVTPKSRSEVPEYAKIQREVAEQVGIVNGKLGDVDWTPLRYINKVMSQSALAGLYRIARVGLVTPLRDGMNLVAKEYVAAQTPDDPGVLVLSQFAGAAQELHSALIVNPYDIEATGAAIARASSMPLAERKERWGAMMDVLRANSIDNWTARFLQALGGDAELADSAQHAPPPLAAGDIGEPERWRGETPVWKSVGH
ncbi:alpha,alpha-trehalose-phosphate synthase (UDP-forming) [Methylocapsa palsarum]|uniref:Trehalose-6-phosphate synthase n=1 Tax=Methylocapsa palsarum TaxID=1612308 RepID=A0A1I3W2T5_9HYPH|nr:alpha,alpha-trehalose-phosphate synthase (UDP-forming) [Methylocapsa palsarum]SFK00957.1 trehalose 6-phosphate synthase [Methylocapsa palsarum]